LFVKFGCQQYGWFVGQIGVGLPDDIGLERQTGFVQTWRSAPRGSVVESIFNLFVKFGCQ
ncbi:MAG: hypothetical protein ACK50P_00310, partial [Planctomycetaceae bacterium]